MEKSGQIPLSRFHSPGENYVASLVGFRYQRLLGLLITDDVFFSLSSFSFLLFCGS